MEGKRERGEKKEKKGGRKRKIKERGPRTRCERCDETVVYLYRRPRPAPSCVVIWTATVAPWTPLAPIPPGNLFGHRNDGTYGTPSIETGLARSEGINADNLLASRLRDIVFASSSPCELACGFLACGVTFDLWIAASRLSPWEFFVILEFRNQELRITRRKRMVKCENYY